MPDGFTDREAHPDLSDEAITELAKIRDDKRAKVLARFFDAETIARAGS